MLRLIAFTGMFVIFSCASSDQVKDEELAIIIEGAQSYKYDLQLETYSVFNMMKSDTTIHFQLTNDEKKQITEKYYSLQLNNLKGKQKIEDSCFQSPKLYTTLRVKSREQEQEIIIDEGCEDYSKIFESKGKRVGAFLEFVRSLLKTKPEIQAAPSSDILYM